MFIKKSKLYKGIATVAIFLVLILVTVFFSKSINAQGVDWTVIGNPSGTDDIAYAVAEDTNFIYIAGYDKSPGNTQWRIEKRRKSDGGVEWTQVVNPSSGSDLARSIVADDTYIYIAGVDSAPGNSQWRIEKRRKSDGGVEWAQTQDISSSDDLFGITADANYIYLSGVDSVPGDQEWRIQKRRKSDGGIEWTQIVNPFVGRNDTADTITEDTNYIYIAGTQDSAGDKHWRIEKRRKSDGGVEWMIASNPSGTLAYARGIAEDTNYIYITGYDAPGTNYQWRIEKRRKSDGGLEWAQTTNPSVGNDFAYSVVEYGDNIYISGQDNVPGGGNMRWRIEKRRKSDGGVEWTQAVDYSAAGEAAYGAAADFTNLYIVGTDATGGFQWRVEKRQKPEPILFQDIGLRVQAPSGIVSIAAEIGVPASPLRIAKDGVVYGIALVDPGDVNDSGVRIQTASGLKALRKL